MQPEDLEFAPRGRSTLERVMLLRSFSALSHLAPSQLAVVAEHSEEHFFAVGSEIFSEGEPVQGIHYIVAGRVASYRRGLQTQEQGRFSVVGSLASLAGISDGQQVLALEDTETLYVTNEDQTDVFEDNFEMLLAVLRAVMGTVLRTRSKLGFTETPKSEEVYPEAPLRVFERLKHIRDNMVFMRTHIATVMEVARESVDVRYSEGDEIWSTGEPAKFLLIVVAGAVRCEAEETSFIFRAGDVLGTLDSLAGSRRWYGAKVESDLVAIRIEAEHIIDIFEDNVDMALGLVRVMANQIISMSERSVEEEV